MTQLTPKQALANLFTSSVRAEMKKVDHEICEQSYLLLDSIINPKPEAEKKEVTNKK